MNHNELKSKYDQDGFVIVRRLLTAAEFAELRREPFLRRLTGRDFNVPLGTFL